MPLCRAQVVNFARFDAKLEQRVAEIRSEFKSELAGLKTEIRTELAALKGDLRSEIRDMKAKLIKWMFLFSAGTTLAGLLYR